MGLSSLLALGMGTLANASEWQAVTGAANLRNFMSGLKVELTFPNGEVSRGEYNPDGTGTLFAAGLITTLPTATDENLGTDRWTLGPELLIGNITPKYVLCLFPNHQWDVAGSGDTSINLTSVQAFFTYLPGICLLS